MGYIYLIKKDDKPVYVGQTIKSIHERFQEHINTMNSEKVKHFAIHYALKKYGINHFTVELLEEVDDNLLNDREIYWIKEKHTLYAEGGYNLTEGGDYRPEYIQCKCYQYDKQGNFLKEFNSIAEAARFIGKNHANIIKALNGEINIAYGYRWSKNKYNILPFKQSNYTGSPKRLAQYSKDGILIKIYPSVRAAADEINYSRGTLAMAAEGKRKTAKGHIWKYIDD